MITACDVSYGFPSVPRQKLQRPDNFNYGLLLRALIAIFLDIFPGKHALYIIVLKKEVADRDSRLHTSGTRSAVLSNLAIYRAGPIRYRRCYARKTRQDQNRSLVRSRGFFYVSSRVVNAYGTVAIYGRMPAKTFGTDKSKRRAAQQIFFVASLEIREEKTARRRRRRRSMRGKRRRRKRGRKRGVPSVGSSCL